jgi:hypothetical protein
MWLFGWAAEENNSSTVGGDAIYHARSKDMLNHRWRGMAVRFLRMETGNGEGKGFGLPV